MQQKRTKATIKEVLEELIDELVSKGILWSAAVAVFEKLYILRALRECRGNVSRASETIGVHRNTLSKKIREYGIDRKKAAALKPD